MALIAVSARDQGNERLVAAGANAVCSKLGFAQIEAVMAAVIAKI